MDQTPTPDIVGIGAVNLDYVIDNNSVADFGGEDSLATAGFVIGSERSVGAEEVQQLLRRFGPEGTVSSPGGSAHNTVASIASLRSEVTVGYVGVGGREPTDGFLFADWWRTLGIDTRFVSRSERLVGMCISCTVDGRRSMLTTGGANQTTMAYLGERAAELAEYLRHAKLIHVTSFAGLEDIQPLVDLLSRVKAIAPHVVVTSDPGAMWSKPPLPEGIDELVALSDWVLLNHEEYEANLERRGSQGPGPNLLRKSAEGVDTFTRHGSVVEHHRYNNPVVLAADEIVDDTGAGDAFAAGFLLSLVTPALSEADGVALGMRVAREKLAWPGLHGLAEYAAIYQRFRDGP